MSLSVLSVALSATSKKVNKINRFAQKRACLSVLSVTDKRQRAEKPNEISACRLVGVVAL